MTTIETTDVAPDATLSELEEIVPRCTLSPLNPNPLAAFFSALTGQSVWDEGEEECGARARWRLTFKCHRPEHEPHVELACDQHHDLLGGVETPTANGQILSLHWEAL